MGKGKKEVRVLYIRFNDDELQLLQDIRTEAKERMRSPANLVKVVMRDFLEKRNEEIKI